MGSNIGGLFAGGSRGTITACYAKGSVEEEEEGPL